MGYNLRPKNKKVKELSVGAFSWPIILQKTGMGYVLGYGQGRSPATYVYKSGNHGSPSSNDGYIVTSEQSKMMAAVAMGFVSVQRFVNKEWDEIPTEEREAEAKYNSKSLFRPAWHEDRLKQIEAIAEFLEKSGGFRIY